MREARDELGAAYRFLRVIENRLQMVADEQTHTLPADRDGLERFARFAGFPDRDAFAEALLGHLRNVQRHYATLFENAPALDSRRPGHAFRARSPTIAKRSTGSPRWAFASRSKSPAWCGAGAREPTGR